MESSERFVDRVALGCMRLSTELAGDCDLAEQTIVAALDHGFSMFDTARAYAPSELDLGHNEQLLARVLKSHPRGQAARIITKCGMRREGGAWIPDGRAKQIVADAARSVETLDGIPIDLLLLHAPDPRIPLSTTARALARAYESGIARRVGVSNVSRKQLEEVAAHVPVSAVEVALGAYDDLSIRSGVVDYCIERGIEILAYAPLGGPDRVLRLLRDPQLAEIASRYGGASAADIFIAYLLAVRPEIVPVVGARSSATVASIANAARLQLEDDDLLKMDERFPALGFLRRPAPRPTSRDAEIVLLMGLAGAGKSRAAETYVARGYERLNRDTAGGTLRAIAERLNERLASGADRFVMDNTYVTRASRSDVLRVAASHGARVRCVFFSTAPHEAQINVVLRMLERFGRVLMPEEIASIARTDSAALAPHAISRMAREMEEPAMDEGFFDITSIPFVREHRNGRPGIIASLALLDGKANLEHEIWRLLKEGPEDAPCLLFGWRPDAGDSFGPVRSAVQAVTHETGRPIEILCCPHPAGPPICWCRPPLPGLFLSFAYRYSVDLRASIFYGSSATDRTLARVFGMSLAILTV